MVTVLKKGTTKKSILSLMKKMLAETKSKGINANKYCGVLNLSQDALFIQRSLRNEWE